MQYFKFRINVKPMCTKLYIKVKKKDGLPVFILKNSNELEILGKMPFLSQMY